MISMILSLFYGSTWKNSFCQGYCVCFRILIATIHFIKQTGCFKKIGRVLWFIWGEHLQPCFFFKVLFDSTGPDTLIFVWKVLCTTYKNTCSYSFCHGDCFNLTRVVAAAHFEFQTEIALIHFGKCSHFLRRAIVAICGGQGRISEQLLSPKNCFFQKLTFSLTYICFCYRKSGSRPFLKKTGI